MREIEVSHWGNIAIEEIYELYHHGAKLIGGFSRYKHQIMKSNNYPTASFDTLVAKLPKLAYNIYYRDQIGNISSSNIKIKDKLIEFIINPRFPLYGGWKTEFYIGYSIPSENSLFIQDDGTYLLKYNFNSIFEDVWVEDMEIKIILPEGCTDINVDIPYNVERSLSKRYTYLDSNINGGRQIIILKAKNIVKSHNKQVLIGYSFSTPRMMVEPLILIMSYFIFFLVISILSRINKSVINKNE
jgi:oligosaccharyltransferase complex subunit alpha (ribophorin I)